MTLQLKIKINDHVTEDENDTDVQDDKISNPNRYELTHGVTENRTDEKTHGIISDK